MLVKKKKKSNELYTVTFRKKVKPQYFTRKRDIKNFLKHQNLNIIVFFLPIF